MNALLVWCGICLVLAAGGALAKKSKADIAQLCKKCDDGADDSACDELVELDLAEGVNVCDPKASDRALGGEYNAKYREGDMVVPNSRAALKDKNTRWPKGIVYYEIVTGGYYTNAEISTIKAAMKEIEKKTCIRFKRRTNEKYWIKINPYKSGCFSLVGRGHVSWQPQSLNLHKDCLQNVGTPVHEMMHALGFYHEQSRPDRDRYIYVDFSNTYMPSQYQKEPASKVTTSNTDYDYGSVMHYGPQGFAIDYNKPVIKPLKQGVKIGQRKGLSSTDAYEINTVYNQCKDGGDTNTGNTGSGTGTGGGSCSDSDRLCSSWTSGSNGHWFCNYDAYVKEHCKKSCNRC